MIMNVEIVTLLLSVFVTFGSLSKSSNPPVINHALDLPTTRPLNVAHRGSSGLLPEHTEAAYRQAIDDGADVIECDIVITRDLELVCRHDPWLSQTTNINDVPKFESRKRSEYIPSVKPKDITDWFVIDFTLDELRTLKMRQGKNFRDQKHNDLYQIVTLQQFIAIAQSSSRMVGIYPEIKHPDWTNQLEVLKGQRIEDLVLKVLHSSGYTSSTSNCIVQSFSKASLQYLSEWTSLPLVLLSGSSIQHDMLSELAPVLYGVGLKKQVVMPKDITVDKESIKKVQISELVSKCHDLNLKVHVYTMRDDDSYFKDVCVYEYPEEEYELFIKLGIDGFFTDFPSTMTTYLDKLYCHSDKP